MRFLNTTHKRKSAVITATILALLLFLMFNYGMKYFDPPLEYGIAINFGNSDFGSGKPVKDVLAPSKTEKVVEKQEIKEEKQEEPQKEVVKKTIEEPIITNETTEDVPVVKKVEVKKKEVKKQEEIKPEKVEEQPKKVEKKEVKKPKPKVSDATKKALQGLLGNSDKGSTQGEGDDNKQGVKGKVTGNPNSSKYYGNGGSGSGGNYLLSGRNALSKPTANPNCEEEGTVVVEIYVNKQGKVVKADPCKRGTTNSASCLCEAAKKSALNTKWNPDRDAPTTQKGKIIYRFSLSK